MPVKDRIKPCSGRHRMQVLPDLLLPGQANSVDQSQVTYIISASFFSNRSAKAVDARDRQLSADMAASPHQGMVSRGNLP